MKNDDVSEFKEIVLDINILREIDNIEDYDTKLHKAAIYYVSIGLKVVPVPPNTKRLPNSSESSESEIPNYARSSSIRSTIDRWFNPKNGKYKGWNIGIGCGGYGNIYAVDLDMKNGLNGIEQWDKLLEQNEEGDLNPPIQKSQGGGRHLLYMWEHGATNTTGKIATSIDSRGGPTAAKAASHINAFPSYTDTGKYEWIRGGTVPHMPQWLRMKIGIGTNYDSRFSRGTGRGNENMSDEDVEQPLSKEQMARMLAKINPDNTSYDDWLRIGQAINTQLPDGDGLELWNEWSKQGSRYERNECITRWRGFNPSGPVRAGTLFYMAKQAGWEPTEKDVIGKNAHIDEIVERLNETFATTMIGGKFRIIRERSSENDLVMGHFDLLNRDDFKHLLENDRIRVGKTMKSVGEVWLEHESRRNYPIGLVLAPEIAVPDGAYNTWNGFAVESVQGDCDLFIEHIREIVCGGDKDIATWVLDWCADMVQNPSVPPGTALVMRGEEGTGKGTFADTLGQLVGSHYRHLIDDTHLTSNFNAHMVDALFVFADEITWGGNKKTQGKLKGLVTERNLMAERKGVDSVMYRSMVRIVIAGNEEWVIPAGSSSRRWMVLDVLNTKIGDRKYFDDLNDQLDNGGREAFMFEMRNRVITSNLTRAPVTQALRDQRAMSAGYDTILQWWLSVLTSGKLRAPTEEENEHGWPIAVVKHSVYNAYEQWCIDRRKSIETQIRFYTRIKSFGLNSVRRGPRSNRQYVIAFKSRRELVNILVIKHGIDMEDDDNE